MAFFGYRGRSIGRLMAFLYRYTYNSDLWQFGNGTILSGSRQIGTYTWLPGTDIPEFQMIDEYKFIEAAHADKRDDIAAYINNVMNVKNPAPSSPHGWDMEFGVKNPKTPIPRYYISTDFDYMAPEWNEEFFRLANHTTYQDGYTIEEFERVQPLVDEKFYGHLKDIQVTYV